MKKHMTYFGLLSIITISLLGFCSTFNVNGSIIGSWISEADSNSKLVFTSDGKCKEYYNNELQGDYTYTINNTSPQCGINVPIDKYTSYLKMINIHDSQDVYCYEINGITSGVLSLHYLESGGFQLYKRQ